MDPRILRTRQLFEQALERLLGSKPFEKISVADIAEASTLNRATFYDHYTDKFALLEGLVSSRFQEVLKKRGVVFDGSCSYALMGITLAMCDYLAGLPGIDCPERRQFEKHFESALMAVVRGMILCGLRGKELRTDLSPELIAATIAGAIYGGANEWVRMPNRGPAEDAAKTIFELVSPMLGPMHELTAPQPVS